MCAVQAAHESSFAAAVAFARPFGFFTQRHTDFAFEYAACHIGKLERAESRGIGFETAERDQLPEYRAPLLVGQICADVEGLELIVAEALHALSRIAAQHVDQMPRTETLAGAIDARERFLRRRSAVAHARRV